jgi:hypothetical protein
LSGNELFRVLKIINGYKVEFEDGSYKVNLVNGNNNIVDVLIMNLVQVISNNSAGGTTAYGEFEEGSELDHEKMFKLVYDNNVKLARINRKLDRDGIGKISNLPITGSTVVEPVRKYTSTILDIFGDNSAVELFRMENSNLSTTGNWDGVWRNENHSQVQGRFNSATRFETNALDIEPEKREMQGLQSAFLDVFPVFRVIGTSFRTPIILTLLPGVVFSSI